MRITKTPHLHQTLLAVEFEHVGNRFEDRGADYLLLFTQAKVFSELL
ncbi:hypothetical protein BSNK01_04700 [Bacillaceae bacterium]